MELLKIDILMYLQTLFNKSIENITKEDLLKVSNITSEF